MYRARVESVSGLQVRAGGKWLNCIGNRAVKVGDLVWTDGRCVYGNDRETQAPLVIAPPQKKPEIFIPFSVFPDTSDTPSTSEKGQRYIYTDKLKLIGDYFDNENQRTTFSKRVTIGRKNVYFDWARRSALLSGTIFFSPAINVDKNENIYALSYETVRVSDNRVDLGEYLSIYIKKNGATVSTTSTANLRENVASKTDSLLRAEFYSGRYITEYRAPRTRIIVGRRYNWPGEDTWMHADYQEADGTWVYVAFGYGDYYYNEMAPRLAREMTTVVMEEVPNFVYRYPVWNIDEYSSRVNTDIIWSFIENEDNWAIIIKCTGTCSITTSKPAELSDPISRNTLLYMTSYWINDPITADIDVKAISTYLITSEGSRLLYEGTELEVATQAIYETPEQTAVREIAGLPPLGYGSFGTDEGYRCVRTSDASGYDKLILPMQDGFYFKINKAIILSREMLSAPTLIDITIYSPSGKDIFSGIFFSDSYLAAYQINVNKYLISVNTLEKATPYHEEEYAKYKTLVVRRGLYLCKSGILEKISNANIENQCLRSSKIFKKWDGALQQIPREGD